MLCLGANGSSGFILSVALGGQLYWVIGRRVFFLFFYYYFIALWLLTSWRYQNPQATHMINQMFPCFRADVPAHAEDQPRVCIPKALWPALRSVLIGGRLILDPLSLAESVLSRSDLLPVLPRCTPGPMDPSEAPPSSLFHQSSYKSTLTQCTV